MKELIENDIQAFIERLQRKNVKLWTELGKIKYRTSKDVLSVEDIEYIN